MHFEFLTEDQSSASAMEILIPKLLGETITFRIHPYKGIGRIPKGLRPKTDAKKRILLDRLPQILRGYGNIPHNWVIVVICDLDDKNKQDFLTELHGTLSTCIAKPTTIFCLAIEEFEAWYLGDMTAIMKTYPKAKTGILSSYKNDSICGTWELLADAVCKDGHKGLLKKGWQAVGEQKSIWAKSISPHMDIAVNKSHSFIEMCAQLRSAAT